MSHRVKSLIVMWAGNAIGITGLICDSPLVGMFGFSMAVGIGVLRMWEMATERGRGAVDETEKAK